MVILTLSAQGCTKTTHDVFPQKICRHPKANAICSSPASLILSASHTSDAEELEE